ncbi:uncharacterized protein LOC132601517 [Lycium barbarum]|uniref:uncharacterized protein LOC132601517 n=1 Tax=Lycium barbarum TaxID=112863 RepID=UPI00293F327B|nr:uncharacterized protein LOC132601517 [Lycium barbarum]
MEPFQDPIAIEEYRRKLGFQNCKVTLQLTHSSLNQSVLVSAVYAKCDRQEREELWEDMVDLANQQDLPWIIGGDFNVIVSDEKKQGGLPVSSNETLDFSTCIQSYGLIDVGFTRSKFTWWNGRTEEDCIFKRLDRILVNHNAHHIVKSFKLLNFWTKHHTFVEVVKENWTADFCRNPFYVFHQMLKKLKRALVQWSRNTYGNIFQQIATIEDTIKVKELQFENNASRENRMLLHQAQAELTRFLHLEEEYWKKKASMKWFNDGDRNTKFFHSYVKDRRNKLTLKRIQDPSGTWLENEVDIGSEAIRFFESQFSEENSGRDYANILAKVLPNIISHNQTGFVKGRSIAENILLAQEIIRDINLRAKHTNVVIKLDMAKAYDRLSWIFLTKVLRQFGFGEVLIDLVWRLLSNNWYSVLINGQSHGFFRSSRGVKKGDPLSPTLFIIAAEVLTRSLNKLQEKPSFIGYGMPKWSPQINHLSYADDTILFCSGDGYSLKNMMRRLRNYEKASGQLVNTDKSCYYVHHKVSARVNSRIKRHTKMRNVSRPV